MKEKACVCIGIFLILALLCSCALFYGLTGAADAAIKAGNSSDNSFSAASPLSGSISCSFSGAAAPLSAVYGGR